MDYFSAISNVEDCLKKLEKSSVICFPASMGNRESIFSSILLRRKILTSTIVLLIDIIMLRCDSLKEDKRYTYQPFDSGKANSPFLNDVSHVNSAFK